MNINETKYVTVDNDYDIRLFYLPYTLKCEMSMNLNIGFQIKHIAFSHNEKVVIIGGTGRLAVA